MLFHHFSRLLFAASCIGLALLPRPSPAQNCSAAVPAKVEVDAGGFSLADLLDRVSCPGLRDAARQMRLGDAPLAGSPRVFEGQEIRSLLGQAKARADGADRASTLDRITMTTHVPERVIVRRAGSRASCAEVGKEIFPSPAPVLASKQLDEAGCALASQIPRGTAVSPTKTIWDATRNSWDVTLHCVHPGDCVPFQARFPGRAVLPENAASATSRFATGVKTGGSLTARKPVARPSAVPGQFVSLLWDQDGVRVALRAVCLDRGRVGEMVRARIPESGRILQAVVVGAGEVRVSNLETAR